MCSTRFEYVFFLQARDVELNFTGDASGDRVRYKTLIPFGDIKNRCGAPFNERSPRGRCLFNNTAPYGTKSRPTAPIHVHVHVRARTRAHMKGGGRLAGTVGHAADNVCVRAIRRIVRGHPRGDKGAAALIRGPARGGRARAPCSAARHVIRGRR